MAIELLGVFFAPFLSSANDVMTSIVLYDFRTIINEAKVVSKFFLTTQITEAISMHAFLPIPQTIKTIDFILKTPTN